MRKKVERRQFFAASPSPVDPYSKLSLSLVSVSFQRNPRPSKIGCRVSMKTRPRDTSRPAARQRSQKPRTRSFSDAPVRPWLVSQFIRFRRGANSMGPLCRAIVTRERLASTLRPLDDLAVLFDKGPDGIVEQIELRFRGPAQFRAL